MKHIFNLVLLLLFFGLGLNAQPTVYPVQSKALILYDLHEFFVIYEDALNHDLHRTESLLYNRNTQIEHYDDLPGGGKYISWSEYRSKIEEIRARRDTVEFRHYNLEIAHIHDYNTYDVLQANVLREINGVPVELVLSLVYYKYESQYRIEDKFRILKIEKKGDSYLPYAWHKALIPDNAGLRLGFSATEPWINEGNWPVSGDRSTGFQTAFDIGYRMGGGLNHAFLLKSGLGFTLLRSEYASDMINFSFDAIDRDNHQYQHEVTASNLVQELSLGLIDVPLGISLRYFFPNRTRLELEGGLNLSYLLSQNLSVLSGNVSHAGHYELDGYSFTLWDLPSYGFGTWDAEPASLSGNLSPFSFSLYGSLTYSHPVSKHVNLFVSPYIRYGLSDLQQNKQADEFANQGHVNSVTMLTDGFNMFSYGARFGVKLSINNIDKNYIPRVRFRREQNRIRSRPVNLEYATKPRIIPGNLRITVRDNENVRHRVSLRPVVNQCKEQAGADRFPDYIPYTLRNDSLIIIKPFGYNIYPLDRHYNHNADTETLAFKLNSESPLNIEYAITPLPAFNLFVFRLSARGILPGDPEEVDLSMREPARELMASLFASIEDGECGYFLYHTADQVDFITDQAECYTCREYDVQRLLDQYFGDRYKELPIDWLGDLDNMYQTRINARRNVVNLHFIGHYDRELINATMNSLQNFNREYLGEVHFHISSFREARGADVLQNVDVEQLRQYPEKQPIHLNNVNFDEYFRN